MFFHGAILTFLAYSSMQGFTFISALTALPNAVALMSLFAMDRVTRNIFKMWLLLPCQSVLLEEFKILSYVMRCGKMRNEL